MTGPEMMRAWRQWWRAEHSMHGLPYWEPETYPLYIGGPHAGRWYVRERHPGVRVWQAEEDGGFALMASEWTKLLEGPELHRWMAEGR